MQRVPQAYQQLNPTGGSGFLPTLGSTAVYMGGENTPSVSSTNAVPVKPVPIPAAADLSIPFQPTSIGIPVARHKAKLEECAQLHVELEKTKEELQIARQRIEGTQRDCGDVLTEASRLHDVVKVLTGELNTKQRRVHDLEMENKQLRQELSQVRSDMEILSASKAVMEKKKRELQEATVGGAMRCGTAAQTTAVACQNEFHKLFPPHADTGLPTSFALTGGSGSASGLSTTSGDDALAPGAVEPISFLQSTYTQGAEDEEMEMEEVEEDEEVEIEEEVQAMEATEEVQPVHPIAATETVEPEEPQPDGEGEAEAVAAVSAEESQPPREKTTEEEMMEEAKKGDQQQQFPEVEINGFDQKPAEPEGPRMVKIKKKVTIKKTTWKAVKKKKLPKTHRPRDVNNPVLIEYLTHCFHHGCAPHVEALRSMYRGDGSMMMVKPPVAFDQLEVYEKLLFTSKPSLLGLWSASHLHSVSIRCEDSLAGVATLAKMIPRLPLLQELEVFGVAATVSMQRLTEALAVAGNVEILSLPQLAVDDEGLVLLWSLLRQREQVAQEQVAEEKARREPSNAEVLSRHSGPRLGTSLTKNDTGSGRNKSHHSSGSVSSRQRSSPVSVKELVSGSGRNSAKLLGGGAVCCHDEVKKDEAPSTERVTHNVLEIRTLDLSHCHVADPMTIKSICCPGVEVMFLAGLSAAVTDTSLHCVLKKCCPSLHTLDISGCTKVTTDAMKYFNRHEHLVVLRIENCPMVKKLNLDFVEVLYSPLNYVNELHMPALRRLPIPMENGSLLREFIAPQLEELSLHGIQIDRETLQPCLMYTQTELLAFQEETREKQLHEEVRHDQRRHQRRFEAEEGQRKQEAERLAAAALLPPGSHHSSVAVPTSPTTAPTDAAEEGVESSAKVEAAEEEEELMEIPEVTPPPSSSLPPEEVDETKMVCPNADRTTRTNILNRAAPPKLRLVTFHNCNFTCVDELLEFLRQQDQMEKLVLHQCSGVKDEHMKVLPKTLCDLDVALTGSLTDEALRFIVTRAPELVRLNLKGAGIAISNNGIHSLYGLSYLQQLNLLGLHSDGVTGTCVSALAASLPKLLELYHETAVVTDGGASAPGRQPYSEGRSSFLHVFRTDDESRWLTQVKASPLELLRLRNSSALKLWMETTLPKPSSLWPVAKEHTMEVAADRAQPALLFTPTPPHTWMAQHPLRPGYTPVLIHPNGVAALRNPPGYTSDSAGESAVGGGSDAARDREGQLRGAKSSDNSNQSAATREDASGGVSGDGKRITAEQIAAARKRAVMEASFSSTSTDEDEDEAHRVLLRATSSGNVLVNPNEVNNSNTPASFNITGGSGVPGSGPVAGGAPTSLRSTSKDFSAEKNSGNMTTVDQQAVDHAEMGPWGEEDAMAEHQELVRNIQQQDPGE